MMMAPSNSPGSLYSFQQQLLSKLAHSKTQKEEDNGLSLIVGQERWLVHLQGGGEISPVPKIAPVPRTQPWFLGLANIRGKLYGVTDLMDFLKLGPTPRDARQRLMLLNAHLPECSALMISLAPGFYRTDAFDWQKEDSAAPPWLHGTSTDDEGVVWRLFSPNILLQDISYLHVELGSSHG